VSEERSEAVGGPEVFRVVEELRQRMAGGVYPRGSLLPSQRSLAEEFGVARDTVQRALRQLKDEAWLEARQGSGTRVVREQRVQSYTARASIEGSVTLREFFDDAFSGADVVLDVSTLSSESLATQLRGQSERIRRGEVAPRRIAIRMLLPTESLVLPYPVALGDDTDRLTTRLRQRMLDITHEHSAALRRELRQLEAEKLVESASMEIRHVGLTPAFKLYLINGEQALHGPYEVIERPIVLDDEPEPVRALDVLGLGATLTHYLKDDNPASRGSTFVESWQAWFESVWTHLAL
jgi:DNA-binding transcriptional regulator YhcF (GntR family)